jgi:hypothetical protein
MNIYYVDGTVGTSILNTGVPVCML